MTLCFNLDNSIISLLNKIEIDILDMVLYIKYLFHSGGYLCVLFSSLTHIVEPL